MAIPKFLPWTDYVVGKTEDGKDIYGRLTYPIYRGEVGNLIYPHEGLKQAEYVIEQIRTATSFSEEAFQYALYRSHYYKVEES